MLLFYRHCFFSAFLMYNVSFGLGRRLPLTSSKSLKLLMFNVCLWRWFRFRPTLDFNMWKAMWIDQNVCSWMQLDVQQNVCLLSSLFVQCFFLLQFFVPQLIWKIPDFFVFGCFVFSWRKLSFQFSIWFWDVSIQFWLWLMSLSRWCWRSGWLMSLIGFLWIWVHVFWQSYQQNYCYINFYW
jgi:hypothetical protein